MPRPRFSFQFGFLTGALSLFAFLLLGFGVGVLWSLANDWHTDGHSQAEYVTMKVFSYIGMGVTALYFCLMVVMRKRVQLAIGVVKQAARALSAMPSLLLLLAEIAYAARHSVLIGEVEDWRSW